MPKPVAVFCPCAALPDALENCALAESCPCEPEFVEGLVAGAIEPRRFPDQLELNHDATTLKVEGLRLPS